MIRELNKRELFLVASALRYARANVDCINEAFMDDGDGVETISIVAPGGGERITSTPITVAEVAALAEEIAAAAYHSPAEAADPVTTSERLS
jgi:hypothetical protein